MAKTKIKFNVEEIKKDILLCFTKKPTWYRKEIISNCLRSFNLTPEELNDTSSSSKLTVAKSVIGTVISSMINNYDLIIDAAKVITLGKSEKVILNESAIEIYIKNLFNNTNNSNANNFSIDNIYNLCQVYFKTNLTLTSADDEELKGIVNNIISKMVKAEILLNRNNFYYVAKPSVYPNTEIGNCLNDAYYGKDLYTCFIKAINIEGGEFFEAFVVNLLVKYFKKCHKTINASRVTGGANDQGIDGIIDITDELGYRELILIQAKVRNKAEVTLKEVRDFYGALCSERGTRGIFITNSFYHNQAAKFILKLDNLIGIDGKKLFELAKSTEYGIKHQNGRMILDDKVFI